MVWDGQLTIPLDEAIRRAGCRNASQFWREIKKGIWPAPLVNSRPPRWSVAALERAAGARPSSDNAGEEKALAALDNYRP
jgi:hypothetical protein